MCVSEHTKVGVDTTMPTFALSLSDIPDATNAESIHQREKQFPFHVNNTNTNDRQTSNAQHAPFEAILLHDCDVLWVRDCDRTRQRYSD